MELGEKMKIGLIIAANLNHSPYVNHYIEILQMCGINYEILEFNKIGRKQTNPNVISYNYLCGYEENILKKIYGYLKFKKFCLKMIKKKKYDKLIVFIPQFAMFIGKFLSKEYKNNYILDIRDYNSFFKLGKLFKKLIKDSKITVISSEGFKNWLPHNKDYIMNHNIEISYIEKQKKIQNTNVQKKIKILNAGVIRSFDENFYLIEKLKNNPKIDLEYRGESFIAKKLQKHCYQNKIINCNFLGAYQKKDELEFCYNTDMINIMQTNNFLSRDAMPNRFYTALIVKRPILATSGNLVGDLVERLNLGVVISKDLNEENLEEKILDFFMKFNQKEFEKKCEKLLEKILKDEKIFKEKITEFIKIKNKKG